MSYLNNVVQCSLNDVFEHDVKQTILKLYQSMFQYKFKLYQEEKDADAKIKLELEVYELIHTLEEMVKKTEE